MTHTRRVTITCIDVLDNKEDMIITVRT